MILHSIRSIQNVASIFRTADGVGVDKIYLCGITPGPLDRLGNIRRQFTKISLGAEKSVSYEKYKSTTRVIDILRKKGYQILAIEQSAKSVPYYKFKGRGKVVVIMGSEIGGLPKTILQKSDKILEIPMNGKKESLNVSIAFGIVAYALKHR